MTVEDPRPMLTAGQVIDPVPSDRWHAASYRCPCGFADDDASEFDRHLDAAEGAKPEHFEVLAGWTIKQVRQWQTAAVSLGDPRMAARAAGRHGQDDCA